MIDALRRFYRGLALFRRMEQRDGLDLMRSGIAGTDKINQRILQTARFGHFAEALASAGELKEALELLSGALRTAEERGERLCEAELHRLRGELLLRSGETKSRRMNFAERSKSRRPRRPGRGSFAPPQALPVCMLTEDVILTRSVSSYRSIPGLRKTSTQPTCGQPEHFWRLWGKTLKFPST